MAKKPKLPSVKTLAIESGKKEVRDWLNLAIKQGTVFYLATRSRSGMSGTVELMTLGEHDGKPTVVHAWPRWHDGDGSSLPHEEYMAGWHHIAKAMGFDFKKRCFTVRGCGFDRVHSVLYNLAVWSEYVAPDGKMGLSSINAIHLQDLQKRED